MDIVWVDSAPSEIETFLDRHGISNSHSISTIDSAFPLFRDDWLLSPCNGPTSTSDFFENCLLEKQERLLSKVLIATSSQVPLPKDRIYSAPVKAVNTLAEVDGFQMTMVHESIHKSTYHEINVINPNELIEAHHTVCNRSTKQDRHLKANMDGKGLPDRCSHCGTSKTSLWRRLNGSIVCNACALYYRLHGKQRPDHLLHQEIRRRNRRDGRSNNG